MSHVIGIDLGTTIARVAVVEDGRPVVIPDSEGRRATPSIVTLIDGRADHLIGQPAKRQSIANPEDTLSMVKRIIGRKFGSEAIAHTRGRVPFELAETENGATCLEVRGRKYAPAEISSFVLMKLKRIAEDYLGQEITQAVITCPAAFDDAQRQATKAAGRIAGLEVLRLINEPTAAALAHAFEGELAMASAEPGEAGKPERLAVYDLGSGTFDVTILERSSGLIEVKATSGDTCLGGEDFDQRIVDHCCQLFQEKHGIDLKLDAMALQRLRDAAERAKQALSSVEETEITLPFITADATGPKHLSETLTRAEFEILVHDLIDRTLTCCRQAMADAGLKKPSQIDALLLVGGMTRMPKVQEAVRQLFGRVPFRDIDPDEAVAKGAAIQGALLEGGGESFKDVRLVDVTPRTLSLEEAGGTCTRLFERNTTIPCQKREIFSTTQLHVLQGEREHSDDNETLVRLELIGDADVSQSEVTFEIDADGIFHVSAKAHQIRVTSSASALTEQQIQRLAAAASAHASEDRDKKALAEARSHAETLLDTALHSLDDYAALLREEDVVSLQANIEQLEGALAGDALEAIEAARLILEERVCRIADLIYQNEMGT